MRETIATWGELCVVAGIDPASTPSDAPVDRVIGVPTVFTSRPGEDASAGCCGVDGCGPSH